MHESISTISFRVKGWWMEKVEKRRMGWDRHKEMKLVHEVKKEVYSRDEARHTEKCHTEAVAFCWHGRRRRTAWSKLTLRGFCLSICRQLQDDQFAEWKQSVFCCRRQRPSLRRTWWNDDDDDDEDSRALEPRGSRPSLVIAITKLSDVILLKHSATAVTIYSARMSTGLVRSGQDFFSKLFGSGRKILFKNCWKIYPLIAIHAYRALVVFTRLRAFLSVQCNWSVCLSVCPSEYLSLSIATAVFFPIFLKFEM